MKKLFFTAAITLAGFGSNLITSSNAAPPIINLSDFKYVYMIQCQTCSCEIKRYFDSAEMANYWKTFLPQGMSYTIPVRTTILASKNTAWPGYETVICPGGTIPGLP